MWDKPDVRRWKRHFSIDSRWQVILYWYIYFSFFLFPLFLAASVPMPSYPSSGSGSSSSSSSTSHLASPPVSTAQWMHHFCLQASCLLLYKCSLCFCCCLVWVTENLSSPWVLCAVFSSLLIFCMLNIVFPQEIFQSVIAYYVKSLCERSWC